MDQLSCEIPNCRSDRDLACDTTAGSQPAETDASSQHAGLNRNDSVAALELHTAKWVLSHKIADLSQDTNVTTTSSDEPLPLLPIANLRPRRAQSQLTSPLGPVQIRRDEVHFPDVPMLGSGLTGQVFAANLMNAPVAIKVTQRRPEGGSGVIAAGETRYTQTAILSAKRLKHEATIYKFLAGRCTCVPRMVLYGDLISVNSQSAGGTCGPSSPPSLPLGHSSLSPKQNIVLTSTATQATQQIKLNQKYDSSLDDKRLWVSTPVDMYDASEEADRTARGQSSQKWKTPILDEESGSKAARKSCEEAFIAMERVCGESVTYMAKRFLKDNGEQAAMGVVVTAFEALAELHGLGVVHGDMQSGNILLDKDGRIWFVDLELAEIMKPGVSNCKIKADLVGLVKTMEHFIQLLGRPLEETSDLVKQGEQRYYELMSQSSAVKKTAVEIGD